MPSEPRLIALLPSALDPAVFSAAGLSHLNWASFPPRASIVTVSKSRRCRATGSRTTDGRSERWNWACLDNHESCNNLPELSFFGVSENVPLAFPLHTQFSSFRHQIVIERSAHDLQFWVLITHRSFHVPMSHGLHHGSEIPSSHENPSAVVMSSAV
jgi:hypothetical protein